MLGGHGRYGTRSHLLVGWGTDTERLNGRRMDVMMYKRLMDGVNVILRKRGDDIGMEVEPRDTWDMDFMIYSSVLICCR